MLGFAIFFLIIAVVLLILEIYLLKVHLGFRPGKCARCRGLLKSEIYTKDMPITPTRVIKHHLRFEYTYTVDKKTYTIEMVTGGKKGSIPYGVTVVYQIKNPKYAYIPTRNLALNFRLFYFFIILPFFILFTTAGIVCLPCF